MKSFSLVKVLASYYPKARKALRMQSNQDDINILAKELTTSMLISEKKRINIINQHHLDNLDGSVILANHQDTLDIFSLVNIIKEPVRFLAKKELFQIPFFKTFILLSNSYSIDRDDARQAVKIMKKVISDVNQENSNVVIFPEATRSNSDLMSEFNTGLFNIVKRSNKPLIPIYIDKSYSVNQSTISIVIGEPFLISSLTSPSAVQLRDIVYDKICDLKVDHLPNKDKLNVLGLGDSITFGEDYQGNYTKGYFERFSDELKQQSLLNKSYNLAVPGLDLNMLNELIDKDNYCELLRYRVNDNVLYEKLCAKKDMSIKELIKQSDLIIFSCGANDSLQLVKQGKVTNEQIYESFSLIQKRTADVITKINKINPKVKIFVIGLYYPYPHLKNLSKFNKMKTLDLQYIKLSRRYKNMTYISTYQEVEANKDKYLINKRNIHLNDDGYIYLKNKVVKAFQSIPKDK